MVIVGWKMISFEDPEVPSSSVMSPDFRNPTHCSAK